MLITVAERSVLKAVASIYPTPSSVKKLVTATGKARNEIDEILKALKLLQLLNTTAKNEVYLLKDGKLEMGVIEPSEKVITEREVRVGARISADKTIKADVALAEKALVENPVKQQPKELPKGKKPSVTDISKQLDALQRSLATPEIDNLEVKSEVLTRLSLMLSDDIADVLSDIAKDLEKVSLA